MKIAFVWCLLGACVLLAQGPVEQEPDHHAGFHNELVYILEPMFPPGHVTREHVHHFDGASVCIDGSIMLPKPTGGDWGQPRKLCNKGEVNFNEATGKPSSHMVKNVGEITTHLRLIENLREGGWTTLAPVSAKGLTVMKESRAFRAYRVEIGSAAHSHPVPVVVVVISGHAATAGEQLDRDGAAVYIPAGQTHQVSGEGRVVEVEIR